MTTWQQDQIDKPCPITNELGLKILDRTRKPTRYVSADIEVRLEPWENRNPVYVNEALPCDEAEELRTSMDDYEQKTGETIYKDCFWKREPWRITITRLQPSKATLTPPKRAESIVSEPGTFETPTVGETTVAVRNYSAGRETIVRGGAVQVTNLPAMVVITVWKEDR